MIYFVIPSGAVSELMLAEAVESDILELHTSLDATLSILTVVANPTYVFDGLTPRTYQDLMDLFLTPEWKEVD